MKVRYVNGANRRWFVREVCGEYGPVEFNQDGEATVTAELGEAMVEAYPDAFSEVKAKPRPKKEGDD